MRTPRAVLVVDDDVTALYNVSELLRESGYECTGAATYDAARQLLGVKPYDLLITDVRLGPLSGLHLIRQCHHEFPGMAFIVLNATRDAMVEIEARRYGASCVVKPIQAGQLNEAVAKTMSMLMHRRRWVRKRVPEGVSVLVQDRPAALLDVSYGGVRFEMGEPASRLPAVLSLEVPEVGSTVRLLPVWMSRERQSRTLCCGAEVLAERAAASRAWRTLVDRLPADAS